MLSMVIVVAFLSIWQNFFPPPVPVQTKDGQSTSSEVSETGQPLSELSTEQIVEQAKVDQLSTAQVTLTKLSPVTPQHTLIDPDRFEVVLDSRGQIDQWSILESQYRKKLSETDSVPYLLSSATPEIDQEGKLKAPFLSPALQVLVNGDLVKGDYVLMDGATSSEATLILKTALIEVKRTFKLLANQYRLTSTVEIRNLSSGKLSVELRGVTRALQSAGESEGGMFSPPLNLIESVCEWSEDVERDSHVSLVDKIEDKDATEFAGARWLGVDSRYFMSALSVSTPLSCTQSASMSALGLDLSPPKGLSPIATTGSLIPQTFVDPQASVQSTVTLYGGPKKLELLDAAKPKLGAAIDFGIFSPICLPMLWAMGFFFDLLPNWGIAIILLTILVKLLTLPLTIKQYRSMAAMKKLQPDLAKVKEQYGDDAMRVQQETMALYKQHGVNPLSGCLPMLVMMPVYFALYRTIYSAVELYQARFFGWLTDLSMPDPLFVTPVILAGLMLLQSRLQPTNSSMDPAQRRLLTVFMPLMFGGMMLFLPSGLVLYILVNTVLGLFQQLWTNRQAEAT